MFIADESDRVRRLAEQTFKGDDRDTGAQLLEQFSYGAWADADRLYRMTNDPQIAITTAVERYRSDREVLIRYRRSYGLPTELPEGL
jgi:hypothetical protein